ncbi:hypothetical protein ACWEGS_16975 [Streptomyces sp. NPDC004822]
MRQTVAGHPRTPRPALVRLLDDTWSVIAEKARTRLTELP